jgi:acetoin utilization deacetylase AcuC-like enzyme
MQAEGRARGIEVLDRDAHKGNGTAAIRHLELQEKCNRAW